MLSMLQHSLSWLLKNTLARGYAVYFCTDSANSRWRTAAGCGCTHTPQSQRSHTEAMADPGQLLVDSSRLELSHPAHLCWGQKPFSGRMPILVHTLPKIPCNEKWISGTIVPLLLSRNQFLCSSKTLVCKTCLPANQQAEGTLLAFLCFCSFQFCLSCRNGLFLPQRCSDI